MATRALKAGSEVDAWCTKCRMDLGHRIIALHGDKIERVECRTCGGHHNYRKPKSASADKAPRAEKSATAGTSSGPRSSAPRKSAIAAADAEKSRTQSWEKAVAGKPVTSFKPYRTSLAFQSGDLIRHAKFGDGYVVRIIDRQKLEVMFQDGPRTLAQSLDA